LAAAMVLLTSGGASAQSGDRSGLVGTIEAGTTINVRTSETINAKDSDGRMYDGVIDHDVTNRRGVVAIPKGSPVSLVVRNVDKGEVALDLESVTVKGQRYSVDVDESGVTADQPEGVGANERTGKYVGGGALLGAIVGAIAGGGKGAAIGAGAGAAAGAGAQVLTRGKSVEVPAETLLTFNLSRPLRARANQTRNQGESGITHNSAAYREGMRDGKADSDRNLPQNVQSGRWSKTDDRSEYEAGYKEGYADGFKQPASPR